MERIPCPNPFGAPVYYAQTVSSTMDTARLLSRQGEPHGTVISAGFQEAGRGRARRPWRMDRGQNLIFTILLRYPAYAAIPPALTLKAGLAVSLALEDFAPPLLGQIRVKWPNDLMILDKGGEGRKAGGILTETEGPLVYAGIGVNLAQREFPKELRDKAVSLLTALEDWGAGPAFPPPADPAEGPFAGAPRRLLEKILPRLWEELEGAPEPWKPRLEERLYRRGEPVTFAEGPAGPGRITKGRLAGIGEGGELLIVPEGAGEPRPFITGELRVY